jgi:hypothetical protein
MFEFLAILMFLSLPLSQLIPEQGLVLVKAKVK